MNENVLDRAELNQDSMERIADGKFRFACHAGVPCFTHCCADLNLALTPYDLLRLKTRLGISSGEFLDRYTTDEVNHNCGLPVLMFKMRNDARRTCLFLQPEGCGVYQDRPGACRLYPMARAAKLDGGNVKEQYFLMRESHCLGFHEEKEWTTQEWMQNQGLEIYNEMNSLWMAIHQTVATEATPPLMTDEKVKMYFMACYNLDAFKKFVFESSFLNVFQIENRTISRIQADETELLKLGFKWVQFAIFGRKTMKLKPAALKKAMGKR